MKPLPARVDWSVTWRLLELGSLVLVAQLADYLYAPTDFILINHFLTPGAVAAYAPAVANRRGPDRAGDGYIFGPAPGGGVSAYIRLNAYRR